MPRVYPVKKDTPDLRDMHFRSVQFSTPATLPKSIDLRNFCSPVVDQGQLGSCTANAIACGLYEFLEVQKGTSKAADFIHLSRLFLYWHERSLENSVGEDAGAMIRDGMKVLNTIGCCREEYFPYDITTFTHTPSALAEANAAASKIAAYHRIPNLSSLKAALAESKPVVLGFDVYTSFESEAVAKTGKLKAVNKKKEQLLGGHAVMAVGYKDTGKATGYVIVRNSWGTSWGDKGYCYMPYSYFTSGLVSDMWTNG
jgi:C1A family cysteine protease